ncbi:hypothetical protein NDU88_006339 [Pleurodeles waltl]|uniref:Uncharacterized protein n=1 Tax=Pleurodeles waltl TaxID=8319 RepID=A0AAV7TWL7_PLEWA|nr:hypothetical protein NDU88_006339 [Pleurodeles waltl]
MASKVLVRAWCSLMAPRRMEEGGAQYRQLVGSGGQRQDCHKKRLGSRTGSRPDDIEEPRWRQPSDPGPAELRPRSRETKNPTEAKRDRPHPWSDPAATQLPQNKALR